MNSCILMAQVVSEPELRSTQDQTNVSSMIVEFPSTREGEAPGTLQVEGWGNLAEEMKSSYSSGDQVVLEGRLSMNVIERDGIKEKKAKLVASRIYPVGGAGASANASNTAYSAPADNTANNTANNTDNVVDFAPATAAPPQAAPQPATAKEDWDEIPF